MEHPLKFQKMVFRVDFGPYLMYNRGMDKIETAEPKINAETLNEAMSPAEIAKHLNILPRDKEKYPDWPKERMEEAARFLWKMNLLAANVDGNLSSLIWEMYIILSDFMKDELNDENIDKGLTDLAKNLVRLKSYLLQSDNPLFRNDLKGATEQTEISSDTEGTKE